MTISDKPPAPDLIHMEESPGLETYLFIYSKALYTLQNLALQHNNITINDTI